VNAHPVGGVGPEAGVPGSPPGPGVAPPFAAPPTDRSRRGLWIGLGIGAVVLVLCCVGGLAGFGVVLVAGTQQAKRQATEVVTTYLDGLRDGNVRTAHEQLCRDLAARLPVETLEREARQRPIDTYELSEPRIAQAIEVDATVRYRVGDSRSLRFVLDTQGQQLKICEIS